MLHGYVVNFAGVIRTLCVGHSWPGVGGGWGSSYRLVRSLARPPPLVCGIWWVSAQVMGGSRGSLGAGGMPTAPVTSPGKRTVCVCGLGSGWYERRVGTRKKHECASAMIWKTGSGQAR